MISGQPECTSPDTSRAPVADRLPPASFIRGVKDGTADSRPSFTKDWVVEEGAIVYVATCQPNATLAATVVVTTDSLPTHSSRKQSAAFNRVRELSSRAQPMSVARSAGSCLLALTPCTQACLGVS